MLLVLSTPSLGITYPRPAEQGDGESAPFNSLSRDHRRRVIVAGIRRDVFQLPLSGSQQEVAEEGRVPPEAFQLPLSGSPGRLPLRLPGRPAFQLPLSGSQVADSYGAKLKVKTFNSLSRDHERPPLGAIRRRPRPFNSLSRDH